MGPVRSSKAMASGLIILILLNVATTILANSSLADSTLPDPTLTALTTNSTEVAPQTKSCSNGFCVGLGAFFGCKCDYVYANCCCQFTSDCIISLTLTLNVGRCYSDALLIQLLLGGK